MQFTPSPSDNPFAILTFLAAPALLTNASALLILSTSNRLARAADRARAASASIIASPGPADEQSAMAHRDFQNASRRAHMLVESLQKFYLAAGCFAASVCIALLGAFGTMTSRTSLVMTAMILTAIGAVVGVWALVIGSGKLVSETRLALRSLDEHHAAITTWRATHTPQTESIRHS